MFTGNGFNLLHLPICNKIVVKRKDNTLDHDGEKNIVEGYKDVFIILDNNVYL